MYFRIFHKMKSPQVFSIVNQMRFDHGTPFLQQDYLTIFHEQMIDEYQILLFCQTEEHKGGKIDLVNMWPSSLNCKEIRANSNKC